MPSPAGAAPGAGGAAGASGAAFGRMRRKTASASVRVQTAPGPSAPAGRVGGTVPEGRFGQVYKG